MRATVLTGLFACVVITAASSSTASAEAPDILLTKKFDSAPLRLDVLAAVEPKKEESVPAPQAEVKPEPKVHAVAPNESLSSIAAANQTTWKRLFDKNEQIANPDMLVVGDKVTVPLPDEQLADRPLPEPPVVVEATVPAEEAPAPRAAATRAAAASSRATSQPVYRGSSSGNTYTYGYCTWYVKNMRPDLPNNLGNADTWVSRAAAQGLPTSSTPRVGAVGQQGMHVVYVQSVNGDGTVTVSEMNFVGWNQVSTRTVPASSFMYIL